MITNKQNKQNKEQKMLKVTVKYQNTNIQRDAMMGWDWLNKHYNLDRNYIQNNYSNVAVHNIPESHPWKDNNGLCEQLYYGYIHAS